LDRYPSSRPVRVRVRRFSPILGLGTVLTLTVALAVNFSASPPAQADPAGAASPNPSSSQPADAPTASDDATASAIAQAYDHPVQIEDSLTDSTSSSALPDGEFQFQSSSQPVRVQDADGWTAVNPSLYVGPDGYLTQEAATVAVEFSDGGTGDLTRIQSSSGAWLDQSWPLGSLPVPTTDGPVATYSDVSPGVDLVLTASDLGMSEVLVVKDETALSSPQLATITFGLRGGTAEAEPNGTVDFVLTDGSSVQSIDPMWWDSTTPGSDAAGPGGDGDSRPLQHDISTGAFTLSVGSLAEQSDLQFPVFVDPDWGSNPGSTTHRWYTDSAYPNQSYLDSGPYTSGYERAGYVTAANSPDSLNHLTRAFYQMNVAAINVPGIKLDNTNAIFKIAVVGGFNCDPGTDDLYRVTDAPAGETYAQSVHTGSAADWVQSQSAESVTCSGTAEFGADPATTYLQTAPASSITFGIKGQYETSAYQVDYKKWSTTATYIVDYDNPPVVTNVGFERINAVPTCQGEGTPTPVSDQSGVTFGASVTDHDAPSSLTSMFTVSSDVGGMLTPISGSPFTSTAKTNTPTALSVTDEFTLPTSTLSLSEGEYAISAVASDGFYPSTQTITCYYQVDNTSPGLPGITVVTGPTTVGSNAMTVQFSATDPDVASYAYWWSPTTAAGVSSTVPAYGTTAMIANTASTGTSAVIAVAPIDQVSTLVVASYDTAGNLSTSDTTHFTTYQVAASPDPRVDYPTGHEWITDNGIAAPLQDQNSNGTGVAYNHQAPMTTITAANIGTDTLYDGAATPVFTFTATGTDAVHTSQAAVDTTSSFSVGAWVRPSTSIASTGQYTLLSEGSTSSGTGFALGISNGQWEFCLGGLSSLTSSTNSPANCATTSATPPSLGHPVYVSGIYDAVNDQLRLSLGSTVIASNVATATVASTGDDVFVGANYVGGTYIQKWVGTVDDPSAFPGVMDGAQLANLVGFFPVNN
jgi:hypothetical protein